MMKSQQKGTFLLELMIVVAIIGIITAFAFPTFFKYIKQAKVAEASLLFDGFKTDVSIWYAVKGYYPHFDQLIKSGTVYKGAFVEAFYNDDMAIAGTPQVCFQVNGFENGKDSIGWKYIPDSSNLDQKLWSCRASESGCTTIDNRYLPYTCQDDF